MQITDKHRIAYKHKNAPGKPVEMAIFRDSDGNFMSAAGDTVAYAGVLSSWVERMLDGTSESYVGEIIPPTFEPHVGMVVEDPDAPENYLVCCRAGSLMDGDSDWVSGIRQYHREPFVLARIERDGWRVRNER